MFAKTIISKYSRKKWGVDMKKQTFPSKTMTSVDRRHTVFATRLRECRERKQANQSEVANVLSVTKSTVSLWENGDTLPDARSISKLAQYYGVSCDFLLCHTDSQEGTNGTAVDELGLSNDLVRVLKDTRDDEYSIADVFNALVFGGSDSILECMYNALACLAVENQYDSFETDIDEVSNKAGLPALGLTVMPASEAAEYYMNKAFAAWPVHLLYLLKHKEQTRREEPAHAQEESQP